MFKLSEISDVILKIRHVTTDRAMIDEYTTMLSDIFLYGRCKKEKGDPKIAHLPKERG